MVRSIVGMTHRGLCRSRCNPALAQQRAEGVAKGMNVNRSAAFVPLVDLPLARRHFHPASNAGGNKVTVKNSHQPGRHGEQRRIGRQRRHGQRQTRLPLSPRRIALVAFPAFLVFRVESNGRHVRGGFLQSRCLVGKPSSKIGGKIGPKGIVDPSRFFSSAAFEHQEGMVGVEDHLPHGDAKPVRPCEVR